jgi:hypothetical protein
VPSYVDEAILRPAEMAGVVIPIAVEDAAAIAAMMRRLDAAVVRPPFAYSALQRHEKVERLLGFNASPERSVKVFCCGAGIPYIRFTRIGSAELVLRLRARFELFRLLERREIRLVFLEDYREVL